MVRFKSVLRFSLRGFLVALTVFAVWLGMEANDAHRKRRIARAVIAAGGQITYLHHEVGTGDEMWLDFDLDPPGPRWLHELIGPDYFQEPRTIGITSDSITDQWLTQHIGDISRLRKLNTLALHSSGVSSEGLACLGRLTRLETLLLHRATFDAALAKFDGLTKLRVLHVSGTGVTDRGLAYILRFQRLEDLKLLDTGISDRGLQKLSRLPNLKHLYIRGPRITDAGLRHLESLNNVQTLTLLDTRATPGGIDRLHNALPQCEIYLHVGWPK
ncbi:MAG: hypothetical protein WD847_06135 [Pirellulales bacterium]